MPCGLQRPDANGGICRGIVELSKTARETVGVGVIDLREDGSNVSGPEK